MAIEDDNQQQGDNQQQHVDNNASDDNQQLQNNEQQQQRGFGNDDLDKALNRFMENNDAKPRSTTQGTQQQGDGQQQPQGDNRPRDAQGRFIEQGAQQPARPATGQQQGQRGAQSAGDQQTQQIPPQARRFGAQYWSDERGNIHDAKGNLVAPSGAGHSQFRKIFPYIQQLEQEVTSSKQRIEAFTEANALARAANLSLDDQGAALQLMVNWRKDPLGTIKTLLQHAQNAGIDVSPIAQGGSGLDGSTLRSAVKELLTEALAPFQPIVEQTQRQREMEEAQQSAMQEYTAFIQEFPDASAHQGSLANIMRDRNVNAREAYFMLRAFAAEQRLDFSKDLAPQLQARQANGQRRAPNGGGNNRPLPDMSGRNNGNNGTVAEGSRRVMGANDSWDSIAEATFEQFGLSRS